MCGIFGYIGNKNASSVVLAGLKDLEYRGYDSWGIATVSLKKNKKSKSKIHIKKNTGKIENVDITALPKGNISLGHTRWATHGGVTRKNAHPHIDCSGRFALIHNGIIENYDKIKKYLLKKHKFLSETDSEVAIHLIEEEYNNLQQEFPRKKHKNLILEAVRKSFNQFEGLNAIIILDYVERLLIAVKNGSPLVVGKGDGENFLSSDAHALIPSTRTVYFVRDEEVVLISDKDIRLYDVNSGSKKNIKFSKINWKEEKAKKGKYRHFMEKEIHEQPKVIQNVIKTPYKDIKKISSLIKKSYGTYLVGCGTAAYACLAGTYLFSKITDKHVNFSVGSEFGYLIDFLTPDSLVIALSQSGETIDVIEATKKAKAKHAILASLVNVKGSSLYRMSDEKLLLNAGVEKAVVSTKAFTAKLSYLILIAYDLANNLEKGVHILEKTVKGVKKVLSEESLSRIISMIGWLTKKRHIYIIGRGLSYPIALETALKIKEASYIHAEGFPAGELKHGVIALVEKDTPCIAFLPNDETYGANLAGAMEMKARGGRIIGISHKPHEIFDKYLPVEDTEVGTVISSAVVGQLLGYYLSLSRGIDPDKPRNLAKSVTVK